MSDAELHDKIKRMQESLAGKVRDDGTFHVTPQLIQSFITQIVQKEIALETLKLAHEWTELEGGEANSIIENGLSRINSLTPQ